MLRVLEHPKATVYFSIVPDEIRWLADACCELRLEPLAQRLANK